MKFWREMWRWVREAPIDDDMHEDDLAAMDFDMTAAEKRVQERAQMKRAARMLRRQVK